MSNKNKNTNKNARKELSNVIATDSEPTIINLKETSEKSVKIEDSTLIKVKSNVLGELIFVNTISKESVSWSMCGEVQLVSMANLRNMKATQPAFFSNQWVVILGTEDEDDTIKPADIYKSLAIVKYYENLIEPSDYNKICNWDESEIENNVALMSANAKQNLIVALNEYINKGVLDSHSKIKAFEKALDCELTEL